MNLKIKRLHPDAVLPSYAKDGDSGLDLHAVEDVVLLAGVPTLVKTGIAVELPPAVVIPSWRECPQPVPITFEAQIRPRSGLALKHGITVVNAPGTVDNGYRGEVGVILRWDGKTPNARMYRFKESPYGPEEYFTDEEWDAMPDSHYLYDRFSWSYYKIRKADRIAQMVVAPVVRCNVVEAELSESERGAGGFGSTGK